FPLIHDDDARGAGGPVARRTTHYVGGAEAGASFACLPAPGPARPRVALALETLRAGLLGRSGRSGLPRTSEAGAEALLDGGAHVLRGGPGNELAEPDGPRARRRGAGAEEPLPVLEEDRAVLEQSSADACLC